MLDQVSCERGGLRIELVCCLCVGCEALHKAITKAGSYQPGSQEELQCLAACVNANAHATGHQTDTNSNTALGMYPVLSMFNHSCNPNLAHSSRGERGSCILFLSAL